jgi:hypothetical protein
MEEGTGSSPLFEKSAADLAMRLDGLAEPEARALSAEARRLAQLFHGWRTNRPTAEARLASIQALFEVNRRAMDLFASHPASVPPTSTRVR